MRDLLTYALDTLSRANVDYADIRFRETLNERLYTMNDVLKAFHNSEDSGIGIRVLRNGRWGFAATPFTDKKNIDKAIKKAIDIAESTSDIDQKPIILTPDRPQIAKFRTNIDKDPFQVPLSEKLDLLTSIYGETSKVNKIKRTDAMLYFKKMHQIFLSTEGSDLENEFYISAGGYQCTAVDNGDFQTRSYQDFPKSAGWEWILQQPFHKKAPQIAEEAVQKLTAPKGPSGKMDLILLPSHLVLTIHESVGHPTELDRVLGWEANMAGISFATTDKLGNFKYGSELVNFVADNNLEGGLASWGFDDDGVPSKRWNIVKDGILVNYGTTRDTAHYIGQDESMGCSRADSYASQPINRIPNLSLMPGKNKLSLDDLIADTEEAIIIDGRGSFSIDQRRYNFQFGGDFFQKIENGKIVGPLRDVTYQAITPEFWRSMDAICSREEWLPHGVLNCGKGEPMQGMQMSHGSAPARFRKIDVGGALNG
ncbi:MAG: TldD/PmbA family protein [Candidatus Zixiibacteriota bacterium]